MAEKKMTFTEKVSAVQVNLHAPKNLYNSFGKYNYRNAEGICEAVKPLLKEYGLVLTVEDDIIIVGARIYVKATATISDGESSLTNTAFAREAESKSGMDAAQITGAASSYARKYALNGLFLLDDTKDPDTDEYKTQAENAARKQVKANPKQNPSVTPRTYSEQDARLAVEAAKRATSRDELKMLNESYPGLKDQNNEFKNTLNARWTQVQ